MAIFVANPQASTVLTFVQYFLLDIVLTAVTILLRNGFITFSTISYLIDLFLSGYLRHAYFAYMVLP